ncbi:helix-turn-helix domain-containing protein [Sphingomonas sp. R647]|uniref:helix-turn-helix domain-containing protein n=1 Tax=Sphingomonas sp. R647 TaxID=2875233 RepID=UPI001CD1C4E3|nr:helix-turn-helix domain-containing protein [Sphingomonas sp. R647]MCA1197751.1 helix-turn-helix domain-containing protein [Sphingomonas sp. R647]
MAGLREHSTDVVRKAERAAYWREHIWASLGDFDIKPSDEQFRASTTMRHVGEFTVARVTAPAHALSRNHQQARGDDRRLFKLVVQHEGTIFLEQRDKRVALKPGDWTLYDMTRPFKFHSTELTRQSAVLVRAEDLNLADLTPYSLRLYSGASGYSSMLRSALTTAASDNSRACSEGDIGVMIARLARLALLEHGSHEVRRTSREVMRERIEGYLDLHLRRYDLSIDTVARGLNCSKRYLHKIFLDSGCTLSEHILQRRLEACRRDLTDPDKAEQSVTDIAYACGFSSLAYFSRVFKLAYGESPRDYRAIHGGMPIRTVQ